MEREYNISWKIQELEWLKTDGLVIKVTWKLEIESEGIVKEKIDTLTLRKGEEIIPLEELTEEIVLGWVKDKLGDKNRFHRPIDTIVNNLKKLIDKELKSPTTNGLPWE